MSGGAPTWPGRRAAVAGLAASCALLVACSGGGAPQAELVAPRPTAPAPTAAISTTTTTAPTDPALASLMDGAGMTDAGRRLFLAARPRIEDKATLAESCAALMAGDGQGDAHTYGCVAGGKVHLRSFDDPEMRAFGYVVAAHELLHLVYGRLNGSERARIDALLRADRSSNAALEERLEIYTRGSGDLLNEVHSVLGTEFAAVGTELESHFSRYIDRARVTAAFDATLGWRHREITRLNAVVAESDARLDSMQARLDSLRGTGPVSAYNALVDEYNALVRQHNNTVAEARAAADTYNRLTAS